ncbi:nephrin-like [Macrosteles quadrilineatus]|uniref:nephrin-like n=1 Tax=Macrosteles quadrilineatus TaxID=74068 RepID=UPI0023E1BA7D|nr:nephrin-like [Macrosteles quadrilineatus]
MWHLVTMTAAVALALTAAIKPVPEHQVAIMDIQAVEGKRVELPCNVTPPGHDKLYMVLWFKADAGIPLYSFDMRGKPAHQARHWSAKEVFGDRAFFRTGPEPAMLVLEGIRRHDEGLYRCRVDFRNTPTRSFRYNLTIVVPPEYPAIFDRYGRQLNGTLGPYKEGDNVSLTCRVVGGRPEPTVRWLVNGQLVDDEYEHNSGDVIENRLTWSSITRKDLESVFSCQASNTNLTDPRETSLVLDLFLKPLTARIHTSRSPLVADMSYDIICNSAGSRPPAVITWYKGKHHLKKAKEEVRDNQNVTTSMMTFVPTTEDDGKVITCRAENPNVTGLFYETTWNIDVVYPPIVSLRLGSTLNASDIKEGDDVYFECHVRANPPWRRLTWLHDGVILSHNVSARLILINQSLVLQKVTRQSAGSYACVAVNSEGDTNSNTLHLRVKYAPTCKQDRILVVGASRSENLDIVCEVDADPPARSFRWKFNNSGETLNVGQERFSSNGTASVLRYTPVADLDYGTLSCWADNAIGTQANPCLFQVVAAGKPFAVRNCSLSNQTASSVEVSCFAGFDGGLPQTFLLELYSGDSAVPRYNISSDTPYFLLADLEPDVLFRVVVFAVNSKGRSPGIVLEELTFRDPEKRTGSDADESLSSVVAVVAGAAATLLLVMVCVLVRIRNSSSNHDHRLMSEKVTLPPVEKPANREPPDEKDPDVIPAKFDPVGVIGNGTVIRNPQDPAETDMNDPLHWRQAPEAAGQARHADSSQPYSWELRPKDLSLSGADPELNGTAIKERLMASRLPESCV